MALSGSTAKSYSSKGSFWLWVEWSATQNVVANTSTITAIVYGGSNSYGYYSGIDKWSYCTIDGTTVSTQNTSPWSASTTKAELYRQTKTVSHNADGTKSVTISGRWAFGSNPVGSWLDLTSSGTFTLDTIPRASKITSFPDFEIGAVAGVTVTAPRSTTAFTNTFELKVGATVIHNTGALSADSYTFTTAQLDGIYALIPNATSITATVSVTTKSGTTQIGTVQSDTATASVGASIVPTTTGLVSAETIASVTALAMGANTFVQNWSKVKFTLSGATGVKSSTIVEHKIVFNAYTATMANTTSTSNYTFNVVNGSGTFQCSAQVKDSRGRWSTPRTLNVTVVAYANPVVTAFTGFRADSAGVQQVIGEYLNTTIQASISSLNSKNQLTYKIAYKLRSGATYGANIVNTTLALGTTTLSTTPLLGDGVNYFLAINSYDIRLTVSDKLTSKESFVQISTGKVPFSFGREGVGAGKVWEQGALDVGGNMYLSGTLNGNIVNANGFEAKFISKELYSNADLNTIQTPGMYFCPENATVATMTNVPSQFAFSLLVEKHAGVKQTFTQYNTGNPIIYVRNMYNGTWGAWLEQVYLVDATYTTVTGGYTKIHKWSDGWMDVYQVNQRTTATAITTAAGSLFRSAVYGYTYPVTFVDANVIVQIMVQNGSANTMYTVNATAITASGCSYMYYSNVSASPTNLVTTYHLRGRWRV